MKDEKRKEKKEKRKKIKNSEENCFKKIKTFNVLQLVCTSPMLKSSYLPVRRKKKKKKEKKEKKRKRKRKKRNQS